MARDQVSEPNRVTCPGSDALVQMVESAETVPPELASHVDTCIECQKELDQLTAGSRLLPLIRPEAVEDGPHFRVTAGPDDHATLAGPAGPASPASLSGGPEFPPGTLGNYHILRKLGEGGMGLVYEAEDSVLKRRVALKLMKPAAAANPDYRARFLREAQAAARVAHDHICPIYQVGESAGTPFLAMPLLQGETLDQRMARGPLEPEMALQIMLQTAEGLAAAHEAGLIHRDVKPSNIWLEARPNGEFRVRLLDFGLARCEAEEAVITMTGTIMGTPAYMAPEQARGDSVDHRADVFSLGAVAWEMFTGTRAFPGKSAVDVLSRVLNHEPELLGTRISGLPESISRIVEQLLRKDPAARTTSARILIAQIRNSIDALPPRDAAAGPGAPSAARSGRPSTEGHTARRRMSLVLACAGLIGLAVWLGILVLRTPNGTLVVEFDDSADIRVREGRLQIHDERGELRYTLSPGTKRQPMAAGVYQVHVLGADGLAVDTERFELKRGETVVVRVAARPESGDLPAVSASDSAPAKPAVVFPGRPILSDDFDDPQRSHLPLLPGTGATGRIVDGSYILSRAVREAGEDVVLPVTLGLPSGAFLIQCRTFNSHPYINFCVRKDGGQISRLSLAVRNGHWQLFIARQVLEDGHWKVGPAIQVAFGDSVDPRFMTGQWIEVAARWSNADYDVWLNSEHIAGGDLPEEFRGGESTPLQFCADAHSPGVVTLEIASIRIWDQNGIEPGQAAPQGLPEPRRSP